MARGVELEPEARELFEFNTGIEVTQVGICRHDSGLFSCSPDGLIGDFSGLEIKCPSMAVHVEYLLGGKVPADYYQQVHGSMLVTGRKEWFFMSYYPGLKPFIFKEKIDVEFCEKLEAELMAFCADLMKTVEAIS
jgi:predicted phage-related endonuclease